MSKFGDYPVLEPLSFAGSDVSSEPISYTSLWKNAVCLMCDKDFSLPSNLDDIINHLQQQHNVIINKIQEIADLPRYMAYWRKRIVDGFNINDICKSHVLDTKDQTSVQESHFYVFNEEIEEDKQLRSKLHFETLQERLDHQQREREDDKFSQTCLFCSRHFHFNRSSLLNHMTEYHHFTIGHPDNLVYTNELLIILQEKLHKLQCLYCEKTFKDSFVLKEHMRKKRHRRLRLNNYLYRQFFIVFPEGTQHSVDEQSVNDDDDDDDNDDDDVDEEDEDGDVELEHLEHRVDEDTDDSSSFEHDDWNDWVGLPETEVVCLYCTHTDKDPQVLFTHMKDMHQFNFQLLSSSNNLVYYEQVKLVNYIRRQVHCNTCVICSNKFDDRDALLNHFDSTDHASQLPDKTVWNQPQYFFPTYENDSLLCALVDNDDDSADAAGEEVIAEDLPEGVRECRIEPSDKIHDAGDFIDNY